MPMEGGRSARMRARMPGAGVLAAAVMVWAAICSPSARADGFMAGAGQADTTPPLAGTPAGRAADTQFGSAYANCPAASFPTQGHFALQEPFNDLNSNGQWDSGVDLNAIPTSPPKSPPSGPPNVVTGPLEPLCDANGNGRWDGLYADSTDFQGALNVVNDHIGVRAVAISDGQHRPIVYASVAQLGIFDFYTDQARAQMQALLGRRGLSADLVVSANHNESSPDSIGIYGGLQSPAGTGIRSGIDEYYMSFLEDRIAHAAADAVLNLQPAQLYANQVETAIPAGLQGGHHPLLSGLSQRISDQFPTAVHLPKDDRIAAVDPKMGLLQARRPDGTPIFTILSQAAHNQEMGNSGDAVSGDWPGAFQSAFDATHAGMSVFLVGDNGSIEDPQTEPVVVPNGSENHTDTATQYIQAQATGRQFAALADAAARSAAHLTPGPVSLTRSQICVPLENNGFLALAAAGEFGMRQGYACDASGHPVAPVPNGLVAPTVSTQFRTFVSYADIGPDLQLIANPGEAFPALMLGSPFGVADESCPRPNPAVPTWHARAPFRFQVGLADDLIGYLIPAWGFASGTPGLFSNDTCYQDQAGHGHKLESESVGPTGANDVANSLASMLDSEKDPSAHIMQGRFITADGHYSHWPTSAVGMLVPTAGASKLDPAAGTLIGAPTTAGFGARAVDASGVFMDYDGQPQATPDVTTRGMMTFDARGCVSARYYLDVFPSLDESVPLTAAVTQPAVLPSQACPALSINGVGELQPTASERTGLPVPSGTATTRPGHGSGGLIIHGCRGRRPTSSVSGQIVTVHAHALSLSGRARAYPCGARRSRVARVTVTILQRDLHRDPARCRFVAPTGRLGATRPCAGAQLQLLAHGAEHWSLRLRVHLARGLYSIIVRAVDTHAAAEAGGHRADVVRLRVA
jgi:hypothetical protein